MHLAGLDPELYVIPWMESLFADSVTMDDALRVWDILLALDARFVPFLCVASIMQVRERSTNCPFHCCGGCWGGARPENVFVGRMPGRGKPSSARVPGVRFISCCC